MGADTLQADYERLEGIAARFCSQAEQVFQLGQTLRSRMGALRRGGWAGVAASTFYDEMDGEVLPALARLAQALQAAQETTLQIKRTFQQAEAEAAALFQTSGHAALVLLAQADDISTVADQIIRLLSYAWNDWSVTARDQEAIIDLLHNTQNLPSLIAELQRRGMLDEFFSRIKDPAQRGELLRLLGGQLDETTGPLVEPFIVSMGIETQAQYNLARMGVNFTAQQFDRVAYGDLISENPGDPFTGAGATGRNHTTLSTPLADQWRLASGDPATEQKYGNPLGDLRSYLEGMSSEDRARQAELLLKQPISVSGSSHLYGENIPTRWQVIEAAASAYDLEPELVAAFIFAEQRDQTQLEDAKEYVGATSILEGNTSIGLGQVVISTARNNDLFSDLLSPETRRNVSHDQIANLLASDEYNIFAVAKYIRTVADAGVQLQPSTINEALQHFPGVDLQAYQENSEQWPDDNIRALASEYTTPAWDNGEFADSPGWGYFVYEAYLDVQHSGVFP